tara:strand:- start:42 stop:554 length:513 start_codon:yes stop_codon:yes gene_type:complete
MATKVAFVSLSNEGNREFLMSLVLSRRKNYVQMLSGIFTPVLFVTFLCYQMPSLVSDVLIIALPLLSISTFLILKSGLKPAAWISNETLYIRDGVFSIESIPLNKVESMEYKTGLKNERKQGDEMHLLIVKMAGFSLWELPIRDMIDHGNELRLFKFINSHFYQLSLIGD